MPSGIASREPLPAATTQLWGLVSDLSVQVDPRMVYDDHTLLRMAANMVDRW